MRIGALASAGLLLLACQGHEGSVVPSEPIQVTGAQFIPGALPGAEPPTAPAAGGGGGPATSPASAHLAIDDAVSRPFGALVPGAAHQQFSGLATEDAAAIGIALDTAGSGYWVVPVGGPDPMFVGKVAWGFFVNFNAVDEPGQHELRLVAIGDAGDAGTQVAVPVCIDAAVPDNLHACIPELPPPTTVISLSWDDDFDLDLHVVTPSGSDISAKNPTGVALDGGAPDPRAPAIDRDSMSNCVADGFRRENLLFKDAPAAGAYKLYVEPFSACGRPAVRFTLRVYTRVGTCPTCSLKSTFSQSGELLALQATGGGEDGLFVHELQLPQGF